MARWFTKPAPVFGIELPRRRFTRWAALYFILYFCLPLLVLCLGLDVLLYLVYRELFDTCYGVLCWFA